MNHLMAVTVRIAVFFATAFSPISRAEDAIASPSTILRTPSVICRAPIGVDIRPRARSAAITTIWQRLIALRYTRRIWSSTRHEELSLLLKHAEIALFSRIYAIVAVC